MVPSSQLRVYEPIHSFPDPERSRWERYIATEAGRPRSWDYRDSVSEESGRLGLMYPLRAGHAFVRRTHGAWLVCPCSVEVSVLRGILAFGEAVPEELAEVLVSAREVQAASCELDRLEALRPGLRDNVAISAWHVPFRWLAAFDDAERILTAERPARARAGQRVGVRVRYETDLPLAVSRLRRAHGILECAGMDESIWEPVEELADWLEAFHRDSTVELDYGTLADLVAPEVLEADRSAGEIWACLEAMELGDTDESWRRYQQLSEWWEQVRAVERSN